MRTRGLPAGSILPSMTSAPKTFGEMMQPVLESRDLDPATAEALMGYLMGGDATDAQIGAMLAAYRVKGANTRELAAFARVLREKSLQVAHDIPNLVDTCGTGGGIPSFNLSTAAAIVAASAGAKIAKHGNRAVTSTCGSADVLEAAGIKFGGDPEQLGHQLATLGIVFLFAPSHHPAMKHVGGARKQLGFRTVFNQLGPLANPAGAKRQLIGVYEVAIMRSMGEALKELGAERALIVRGTDGLDEISPCAPTEFVRLEDGYVSVGTFTPADFGLEPIDASALVPGKDLVASARILEEAVTDADSPRCAAILPNAAAALWLAGVAQDLAEGAAFARNAVRNGDARSLFLRLRADAL